MTMQPIELEDYPKEKKKSAVPMILTVIKSYREKILIIRRQYH